jgi:retinol dehydrogenase-12
MQFDPSMTTSADPADAPLILITGGSAGLGRATARALARRGARIVIVGKDLPGTRAAVDWIKRGSGNPRVDFLLADLADPHEVRSLALAFGRGFGRLDVLINDAQASARDPRIGIPPTAFERTWAFNHLARVGLILALLPLLQARGAGRIVNVSSWLYPRGRIDFDDLVGVSRSRGLRAQARSQLATVLFTRALARRLAGSGVTVNSCHRGLIDPFERSLERAAATPVRLASAPELAGVTGRHFVACKPVAARGLAADVDLEERLWRFSLEQLGLADDRLDDLAAATDDGGLMAAGAPGPG